MEELELGQRHKKEDMIVICVIIKELVKIPSDCIKMPSILVSGLTVINVSLFPHREPPLKSM